MEKVRNETRETPGYPLAKPSVLAAMSGGVDSSLTAVLLQEQGYNVAGITMKLFGNDIVGRDNQSTCCSLDDVEDARAVCRRIGIPHYTLNFGELFGREVIERFCEGYLAGATPNPCIDCNRYLKFEALQRRRQELGFDYVATGHYVRRRFDEATGQWKLLRAADASKDQSYVLYHITQDQLSHMLFPLGNLTKDRVRASARDRGLVTADKPESQDICFVPDGDYAHFIERYRGKDASLTAFQSGLIVDRSGATLGTHRGLIHYTVGQRKGIGVAARRPLYVFDKNTERNELIVGFTEEVLVNGVVARDVNLIAGGSIQHPLEVEVKTHYRQKPVAASVRQTADDELTIQFREPQRACAKGQAAVVYRGDEVLGGGTIVGCL